MEFSCPYLGYKCLPQFNSRDEYIYFCKKNKIKVLTNEELNEISWCDYLCTKEERQIAIKQERRRNEEFHCPYPNLENKRGVDGKILPRFNTRSEYEAYCEKTKCAVLTNLQLWNLAKEWEEKAKIEEIIIKQQERMESRFLNFMKF